MRIAIVLLATAAACSGTNNSSGPDGGGGGSGDGGGGAHIDGGGDGGGVSGARTIFVIPMENESASNIYNNTTNAPYINNMLVPIAAKATNFQDELPSLVPSEPHYVWMEAGTNSFSDQIFLSDSDSSSSNSTNSTAHLVTQLKTAGLTWMSYQEGITAGTCPISSISGTFYAAKHDPMVFFQDVVGSTPSSSNAYCIAHHKPYSSFATDLAGGSMPNFVFITPNLCNDMHGASGCASGTNVNANIKAGDTWLSKELPRILDYASTHNAAVYLTWDEGSGNNLMAFLAFGPHVKVGPVATSLTHSSLVKSIEEQLGVPVLASVSSANDFSAMFDAGYFP